MIELLQLTPKLTKLHVANFLWTSNAYNTPYIDKPNVELIITDTLTGSLNDMLADIRTGLHLRRLELGSYSCNWWSLGQEPFILAPASTFQISVPTNIPTQSIATWPSFQHITHLRVENIQPETMCWIRRQILMNVHTLEVLQMRLHQPSLCELLTIITSLTN